MISQNNYELVKPFLYHQAKDRGWNQNFSRADWDTFSGWKKRGKTIIKGSKGFRAEIVFPYIKSKHNKKIKHGFFRGKTTLFFVNQTR
tara:strand:- start:504 stop:767 length:264 start_codon:yes stop_codon:yes gene_type:complete